MTLMATITRRCRSQHSSTLPNVPSPIKLRILSTNHTLSDRTITQLALQQNRIPVIKSATVYNYIMNTRDRTSGADVVAIDETEVAILHEHIHMNFEQNTPRRQRSIGKIIRQINTHCALLTHMKRKCTFDLDLGGLGESRSMNLYA